jgi:hypothetical protein
MDARFSIRFAIGSVLACFAGQAQGQTLPTHDEAFRQVQDCFHKGLEAVLHANRLPECAPYFEGHKKLESGVPINIDVSKACSDENRDLRRMAPDAIKKLAANKDADRSVDPTTGIRIRGAVFCQRLDLVGLDLTYSLVLDYSLFRKGIDARNFQTRADFSIDNSLVFDDFGMLRAHIGGAVFASEAYIEALRILDSEIKGSLLVADSLVLEAAVDGLKLSGEMRLSGSALSYLVIQFSKIGGMLNISRTEARCAYFLKKNEIGEVLAANFGFGTVKQVSAGTGTQELAFDWSEKRSDQFIGRIIQRQDVREALDSSQDCNDPPSSSTGRPEDREKRRHSEIALFDNRVNSSLCIISLRRLRRVSAEDVMTVLTLNYTTVGNYAIINLGAHDANRETRLTFNAVGFETKSLILNFDDLRVPESKFIDALRFDRVYQASRDIRCPDQKLAAERGNIPADPKDRRQFGFLSESNLKIPTVEQILRWLSNNDALTLQPFTAFIEAFEKSGNDALDLRIARV